MSILEIKLSSGHFSELIKKGFSLDMIFLLKVIEETDEDYLLGGKKGENIVKTMERKGLISEKGEVTEEGKELLTLLSSSSNSPKIPRKKREIKDDDFLKWWKEYPGTDTFTYKGRSFKGTRALRVKKDECRNKVEKILKEGEYTIDDLIEALKLEIEQKKEHSIKSGENKMKYFQNSLTYINQCTYEPFIELVKAGHKAKNIKESPSVVRGGVDI